MWPPRAWTTPKTDLDFDASGMSERQQPVTSLTAIILMLLLCYAESRVPRHLLYDGGLSRTLTPTRYSAIQIVSMRQPESGIPRLSFHSGPGIRM